jgi:hypothetical protein
MYRHFGKAIGRNEGPTVAGHGDAVRELHRSHVLGLLREHGPSSRGDLMRATGFSRPTIAGIVTELLGASAIREVGKDAPGTRKGRPARLLGCPLKGAADRHIP